MNKKISGIIVAFFISLLMLENSYSDNIKAAGIVYCPYTCDIKKDGIEGFMIDIAKKIFRNAGHTYTVTMFPFRRALEYVTTGEYDALAICNKADVPEGGLIFPDIPIAVINNSFALRKDEIWKYNGIESLKKIRIGTVIGYTFKNDELNNWLIKDNKLVERIGGENVVERNLNKLVKKHIDAYIDDINVIKRIALKAGMADGIKFSGIIDSTPHFVGFTPGQEKSLRYAKILSDGMRRIRRNGELDTILIKYGIEDWE